eukprot:evm.model.scf_451.6 EVM.evm.TU.scf_451.6   scf_451:66901-67431(+)
MSRQALQLFLVHSPNPCLSIVVSEDCNMPVISWPCGCCRLVMWDVGQCIRTASCSDQLEKEPEMLKCPKAYGQVPEQGCGDIAKVTITTVLVWKHSDILAWLQWVLLLVREVFQVGAVCTVCDKRVVGSALNLRLHWGSFCHSSSVPCLLLQCSVASSFQDLPSFQAPCFGASVQH